MPDLHCIFTIEQSALKNENNCLNSNIYSYLKSSGGQSSNLYLNVVHMIGLIDYTESGRESQTRQLILKHVKGDWTAKLKIGCSGYAEGIWIMAQLQLKHN